MAAGATDGGVAPFAPPERAFKVLVLRCFADFARLLLWARAAPGPPGGATMAAGATDGGVEDEEAMGDRFARAFAQSEARQRLDWL